MNEQNNAVNSVKVKVIRTGHESAEKKTKSSTLFLTLAPDGVGSQRYVLPPPKARYPLRRKLGGPQSQSGQLRKISPPPGFDPRTVRPVASCFTD